MGSKTEVQGGGKARGVSKDFLSALGELINSSSTSGADTGGVAGALSALLAGPDQGGLDSIRSLQERSKSEDLAQLRAQFGTNTSSRGTPAAAAFTNYLTNRAPSDTLEQTNYLDKNRITALSMLLPLFSQAISIGTPQAQLVQKPTLGQNILSTGLGIAGAASNFIAPGFGTAAQNFGNWASGNATPSGGR